MNRPRAWLLAARPRTLPLALASILMGSFLAAAGGAFSWLVFALAVLTTTCLQILSNLANDYGDSIHGADSADREGPARAVQSGLIPARQMRLAVGVFSLLSLASGVALVLVGASARAVWVFLALGMLAIAAAITYTAGSRPYGYVGLGDLFVMIFFGYVGVLGVYYLHTQTFVWLHLLPATACGLFATAVLNVNNIRDLDSDRRAGKRSVPVRLGPRGARVYHVLLLAGGVLAAVAYVLLVNNGWQGWLFLVTLGPLVLNALNVWRKQRPSDLDPYLKQMALTTLLFVITFGLGQLI